jgi:hypothetical protein
MPGHDTFRRVVSRVAPEQLTPCLLSWTTARRDRSGGDSVALDGNTLRHALARAAAKAAIPLVSAWAHSHRLVLGQVKGDAKSNAMTAMPQLLTLLDLTGAPVTMDARGCQQASAQGITEHGADDV